MKLVMQKIYKLLKTAPAVCFKFLITSLVKLCYRIKVHDSQNIPADGPALIVCNHASWSDALIIGATQKRNIRFIMARDFYDIWFLRPIAKLMNAIPISPNDPPKQIVESLKTARRALQKGRLVCIFAEGAMTRSGLMLPFKSGFEKIIKSTDAPIIPAHIGGMWGSIFSYYNKKPFSCLPKKFPYPVSIHFGKPIPSDSSAFQVQQKIRQLSTLYCQQLKSQRRPLPESFIKTARKNWKNHCISDSTGKRLTYAKTLMASLYLSKKFKTILKDSQNIGLLLPPSVGAAISNIAVSITGKVPVNINYTASKDIQDYIIKKAEIEYVLTSKLFLKKIGEFSDSAKLIYVEDLLKDLPDTIEKISLYIKARFFPRLALISIKKFDPDSVATIIFSSGSSGQPKGVMLTHHNILSNMEGMLSVFRVYNSDNLCALLPFFHSFGFTCSLWMPIIAGASAHYIPNPLDAHGIGNSVKENNSTILFATPTFLLSYIRRIPAENFKTLRSVIVGAEKLKPSIADAFQHKFNITPLEGYGTTELSPVVSLNLENTHIAGVRQISHRPGTVGQLLPGIAVKILSTDDDTEITQPRQPGLVLIKGSNVMLGYLDDPQKTDQVLKDGWYDTGDVGFMDEKGFLTITDRISRFSKIAGEMISHVAVEHAILDSLDIHDHTLAVTSIPDEKKGEQLAVLYIAEKIKKNKLIDAINSSDLSNIAKPKPENLISVDQLPLLGSGKLDVLKLKTIAIERTQK